MSCSRQELQRLYPAESHIVEITGSSKINHRSTVRLKCTTKEEFLKWLHDHQSLSGFTFRSLTIRSTVGTTVIYKGIYCCHHNTRSHKRVKNPSKKHTGCKARLTVTIKSSTKGRRVRSKDKLREEYPTLVNMVHEHNHLTDTAEVTKYKHPTQETKNKFRDLLRHHGPTRSLDLHKKNLQEEYGDNYYKVAFDRSLCPDYQWVYRLYDAEFRKKRELSSTSEEHGMNNLTKNCQETNINCTFEIIGDNNVVGLPDNVTQDSHSNHIMFEDEDIMNQFQECNKMVQKYSQTPEGIVLLPDNATQASHPEHVTSEDEDIKNKFEECNKIVQKYYSQNPEGISAAMDKFFTTFMSLNTETSLTSALHNFGKEAHVSIENKKHSPVSRRKCKRKFISEHGYSKENRIKTTDEAYLDSTPLSEPLLTSPLSSQVVLWL